MHERLNITLPAETIRQIDRIAKRGDRSRLIAEAVRRYIVDMNRAKLRSRVKEGALRRAKRDQSLAEEWFSFEDGE